MPGLDFGHRGAREGIHATPPVRLLFTLVSMLKQTSAKLSSRTSCQDGPSQKSRCPR